MHTDRTAPATRPWRLTNLSPTALSKSQRFPTGSSDTFVRQLPLNPPAKRRNRRKKKRKRWRGKEGAGAVIFALREGEEGVGQLWNKSWELIEQGRWLFPASEISVVSASTAMVIWKNTAPPRLGGYSIFGYTKDLLLLLLAAAVARIFLRCLFSLFSFSLFVVVCIPWAVLNVRCRQRMNDSWISWTWVSFFVLSVCTPWPTLS